jgi:hypothetical protein
VLSVLAALFSENLQRDLIAVERSRRAGVRLKMNEQLDDLVLCFAVVKCDTQLASHLPRSTVGVRPLTVSATTR